MAIVDYGHPSGLLGRSTLANDTPGQIRLQSYVDPTTGDTNEPQRVVRLYNNLAAAASTVKGAVYMVVYDGDEESNPQIIAPAAVTANCNVVVALGVNLTATWGWYAFAGYVDALVEGTTDVAKDDFLKVTAPNAQFVKDGATKTTDSFAISTAAQAADSAVLTKVWLIGSEADVD